MTQEQAQAFIDNVMDRVKDTLDDLVETDLRSVIRDRPILDLVNALHRCVAWSVATEAGVTTEDFSLEAWN
jgi:hypothetical protein